MERISGEVEQRKRIIAEAERRIAGIRKRIEKAREVGERISKLKARRADGGTAGAPRGYADGSGSKSGDYPAEGPGDRQVEDTASRIAGIMREAEQRKQSRERTSIKERIEANKRLIAKREREKENSRQHDRGMSR